MDAVLGRDAVRGTAVLACGLASWRRAGLHAGEGEGAHVPAAASSLAPLEGQKAAEGAEGGIRALRPLRPRLPAVAMADRACRFEHAASQWPGRPCR